MRYLAFVLLLLAAPVYAQSLKTPTTIFLAASAIDWSSTAYCVSQPGCHETNPLIKWAEPHGAPALIGIGAAADVTALYAIHRFIGRSHQKLLRVGLYSLAAVRVVAAVSNVREAHRYQPH